MLSNNKGLRVNTSFNRDDSTVDSAYSKDERVVSLKCRIPDLLNTCSLEGLSPIGSGKRPPKRNLCNLLLEGTQSSGISPTTQNRFSQLTLGTPVESPKRTCDKSLRNSSVFVWPIPGAPSPSLSPKSFCGISLSFSKNISPEARLSLCAEYVCSVFQTLVRRSPKFVMFSISEKDANSEPLFSNKQRVPVSFFRCVTSILRLHKAIPFAIIILALKLVERVLVSNTHLRMSRGADSLFFTVSVLLAQKVAMDKPFTLKSMSGITGVPVKKLNSFEREFLSLIDFKLNVSAIDYCPFLTKLHAWGQVFAQQVGSINITISLIPF